ncbi:sugar phosphate isomerase/epimerase family protein [Sediminibacillus massiliensis]|uniref:sugar phosphate isomerase/epimerase family protein n=1 Tax=Sediminibacillus massiliensis TaxID=1926277 RepID=UPI0009884A14|nr:sugar phosphate isomerase/epimerase family protein [Sediminibacillus massiliensis]
MRFGCCADIRDAGLLHEAGFDFIECTVTSLVPERDEDFPEILQLYQESPLPVEVCNIFLPGTLKITGENVDQAAIKQYLEKALPRVKQIGVDTIVFGSGGARSLPEGFSRHKGEPQIIEFLHLAADYAEPLGLTIVIEPLNREESNIINSIPEAVQFAKKVNRKSIQVLADFYHMEEEKEQLDHLVTYKDYIRHVHVADTDRQAPGKGSYPYPEFNRSLNLAQYNGRISIESKWNDFEQELADARRFLAQSLSVSVN